MPTPTSLQVNRISSELQLLDTKIILIEDKQNSSDTSIKELSKEYDLLKKLVVTGNGEISLLERFRNIEKNWTIL